MTRLFGTDGIRGKANVDLKPSLAHALGRATAHRFGSPHGAIVVGQDTRRSCDMLVAALVSGATSLGVDVLRLGVCPTPALAHVTASGAFGAGIMVSASHNPADDNGLKVLNERGLKLDDRLEEELESLIWRSDELGSPGNGLLGRDLDGTELLNEYRDHRLRLAATIHSDLRVGIDCAHGSGGVVAPVIIGRTGAHVRDYFNEPDGTNINHACGATAPEALAEHVISDRLDVGFALDGDADRCVAVDERGVVVDGDQLIGLIALDRMERDALPGKAVVVSVLSNGGLAAAIEAAGGRVVRTQVGDKHILDAMLVSGAALGGEKSGHVIIGEHVSSGDGIVTALEVLGILARRGRPLSELAAQIPLFPQQQRAVLVRHKEQWEADAQFVAAMREAEHELDGVGRLLIRPSGTEPKLRIMVEGSDASRVGRIADLLATLAAERLN